MALESMTGFGRGESSDENYRVVVELKSVNHRYRDFRFRVPSLFSSQEISVKQKITENFKRGSFDLSVNYKKSENKTKFSDIDPEKVNSFINTLKSFNSLKDVDLSISPSEFLRSEFYYDMDDNEESMTILLHKSLDEAIENLKKSRLEEGLKLKEVLKNHRSNYFSFFNKIEKKAPEFQKTIDEKIRERMHEYKEDLKVDEPRLLQEVIFYLEKMDIHEEINRINSHLEKLDSLINSDKEVGRQLDFLVQELNRETNTIGSKSNMVDISDSVVKMKVELEKIREQGLNLQ